MPFNISPFKNAVGNAKKVHNEATPLLPKSNSIGHEVKETRTDSKRKLSSLKSLPERVKDKVKKLFEDPNDNPEKCWNNNLLIKTAEERNVQKIKQLLSIKNILKHINTRESYMGDSLLAAVKKNKQSEIFKLLVNARATDNDLFYELVRDQDASNPINEYTKMLIDADQSHFSDSMGNSLIMYAIKHKKMPIINYLSDNINKELFLNRVSYRERVNNEGQSMLILAAKTGLAEVVQKIIKDPVNIQLKDHNKKSALDYAIENQDKEAVEILTKALTTNH